MFVGFLRDLKAGWAWFTAEMSRPMPGVQPMYPKKLEPRRTRQPSSPANNYDEDGRHEPAYDGDAFSGGSSGGDGD